MSDTKVLVVFGITGIQGGSVANSILNDPKTAETFEIRGITRDKTKPAAQAWEKRGVEILEADMDDEDSLRKALQGAYAVFSVTNFGAHMNPERETRQGVNVANAAAEAGAQHFIWSSLRNITELSEGRYTKVAHFDSKAKVEEHIRNNLPQLPSTFFLAGSYMSNFTGPSFSLIQHNDNPNEYTLTLPVPVDKPVVPLFEAKLDTGKFVKAILTKRDQTLGKRVLGATKYTSTQEMAEVLTRIRGKTVAKFEPTDEWKMRVWEPLREELAQNMEMLATTGYYGNESLDWSLSLLDEPPTTWEEHVRLQSEALDLEVELN